ncbi:MliC family protein [Tamlana sp. 2_MG-2023]|uniref:MliC family protein n=1 Tax=unclassified Tamlana TaxID=2614803 RepID=UPI0026E151C6|nr:MULTISPECIES: MliC family protein [unclassified Tamlana]MDO6760475.1 MliC family protein [Tamlana sp. 2_MG-2023]MDO6790731.1 MliC family protein [Tamlana sp. 1_MG-2023]
MIRKVLIIVVFLSLVLTSCKEVKSNETDVKPTEIITDEIVESTVSDESGKTLYMTFNNTKGTVTIDFEGEITELKRERSGSGFWYKNNTYNLRGKGENMTLKKDGVVVFEN